MESMKISYRGKLSCHVFFIPFIPSINGNLSNLTSNLLRAIKESFRLNRLSSLHNPESLFFLARLFAHLSYYNDVTIQKIFENLFCKFTR